MLDPPIGAKCAMGLITPIAQNGAMVNLLCEASWTLEDLIVVLLLHVRHVITHAVKRSSRLQFVLHVRRASTHAMKLYLNRAFDLSL